MHGGKIFVRGHIPAENLAPNIAVEELTGEDLEELSYYVEKYCSFFGEDFDRVMRGRFRKLVPSTSRPYANLYTPN